jgi:CRP-like cAMP-binding protein
MKQKILLIEDNREIRENTAEILVLSNYDVITADNGKVGIEKALSELPDLIICDIMMPVLDGYGVLHLLNKNDSLNGIPFIFLTANNERKEFRRGMEMGADDFITKPFTEIELLSAIESRLKKAEVLHYNGRSMKAGDNGMIANFGGDTALEKLIDESDENFYRRKQVLYSIGNYPHRLYYIKSGKIKTYISNENGKVLTTSVYGTGDFFGYTALLEEMPYKETAETIDDSNIISIPAEEFKKLLNENMDATRKFVRMLSKNVVQKEAQLLNIAYNSLRKRVAVALTTLTKKFQEMNHADFTISFSREDLANIAGTATESLIRTLSDFKQEKLIEIDGGKIIVLEAKKLENMIN